jgi:hypothetical protein
VVEQIDEIDIAIEIRVLLGELHHHALQLHILGLGHVRDKANDSERLLFHLCEGGRLVE